MDRRTVGDRQRPSAAVAQRLARLLGIVEALAERPHRRRELARRFSVSERQVTDDLGVLNLAGIAVRRTEHGYVLDRAALAVPGPVAPGEAVSVQGGSVRLVRVVPKGTVTWVEEAIEPQPPAHLLRWVVPDRAPRGLYPLNAALRRWLRGQAQRDRTP